MERKPWELTDEELYSVVFRRPAVPIDRAVATAAARKALEWAANESHRWRFEKRNHDTAARWNATGGYMNAIAGAMDALGAELRKELSDG